MEELDIEFPEEELEEAVKGRWSTQARFPTVHVGSRSMSFNSKCFDFVPKFVRWYTAPGLAILLPAPEFGANSFAITHIPEKSIMVASIPSAVLVKKNIRRGHYKLYKYRDGVAIKLNERLEDNARD